jgi:hypothetical protein
MTLSRRKEDMTAILSALLISFELLLIGRSSG